MRRNGEGGEGKLGTIVWLVVFIAMGVAIWNVAPVYIANYSFADKVNQIARTPRWGASGSDERIVEQLVKAASEEKLEQYVNRQTCRINTMDTRRTIVCEYGRQVNVIPGWRHNFNFKIEADQPLI